MEKKSLLFFCFWKEVVAVHIKTFVINNEVIVKQKQTNKKTNEAFGETLYILKIHSTFLKNLCVITYFPIPMYSNDRFGKIED